MTDLKPRHLLLAFVPLAIAGCVTADEVYQDTCTSFGFRPGTDAFANCMMEQSARHDEDEQRAQDRIYAQEQRDRERKRERRRREERQIDTRPQFDKDGNPNFDTQGNYVGCHGVGCEVDNPDNPAESDN
ncbi:hypothetical protein ACFW0F_09245 [Brucella anthropi]|jgi:hypothetical protein|uniref:hypothetical protein n=1 Tax=Brucella anthropi TaxID=529 RepID=UPI000287B00B|nr:hypothetical protein [Brucella anthropi]